MGAEVESIGNRSGELKIRKNDDLIYIEGTTGNGYKRMIWIDWQQLSFIFHWRTSRGHVNQMYLGYVLLTNNHQISVLSDTQRSFVSSSVKGRWFTKIKCNKEHQYLILYQHCSHTVLLVNCFLMIIYSGDAEIF